MHWSFPKITLFLLLFTWQAQANAEPFRLLDHLEYWEDRSKEASIDQVQENHPWISNQGASPSFGFNPSAFWFRFTLPQEMTGTEPLVLLFHYALVDDIQLYMPQADGGFTVTKTGRKYPASAREIPTQDLALEIPLVHQLPGQSFYLRMQTQGSAQYTMELMKFHAYYKGAYERSLPYRLFMGSMIIMILYNLIFFLVTRVYSYLIYVLFISTSTLYVMSAYGLSYLHLWPDAPTFNRISLPFFLGFSIATLNYFNIVSLRSVLSRRVKIILGANSVMGLLIVTASLTIPYRLTVQLAALDVIVTAILLPVIYIGLCRKRYRPAYFFLLSIGSLAFGALIYAMKAFGLLSHNFVPDASAMIASASQITLLTFALADQYREIQVQNKDMQQKMIEMQSENIRLLDRKVDERTRDVRVILSSIQQGIFTISGQPPRIDEEYSRHLESMFPDQHIAGADPLYFLSESGQFSGDEKNQIQSAILCSLDSPRFTFEINEGIFPKHVILQNASTGHRTLQVEWSPVLRKDESVGKILVALRDVTRLLELEEQKTRSDSDLQLLNMVLTQSPVRVQNFLRFNRHLLERIHQHVDDEDSDHLKPLLHTLKGNSRTLGLPQVANACHELEDLLKAGKVLPDMIRSRLYEIDEILGNLARVADRISASGSQDQKHLSATVQTSFAHLRLALTQGPVFVQRAAEALAPAMYRDLQETVTGLAPSLDMMAKDLHKPKPQLHYTQSSAVFLEQGIAESLQSTLVHILTNALIHGIEEETERLAQGKPGSGQIKISVEILEDIIHILISDDGRGLDLAAIQRKAQQSGVLAAGETNPQRIAESIFSTGISTAAEVSMHAGRGVGMTAVRDMLHDIGAEIRLEFTGAGVAKHQPFAFAIDLPRAIDPLIVRVA